MTLNGESGLPISPDSSGDEADWAGYAGIDDADAGDAGEDGGGGGDGGQPVVAVVGRPNVGKSTLVNRILGSRQAVVEDVPGVTRDRVAYDANWRGRTFTLLDTGGWEARAQGLAVQVAEQARIAVEMADAVLFVVDARVGATDEDEAVANVLRRSGKPVVLAANKVDDARSEADAASLWSLGLGEPVAVSALHGRGSGDLLDLVLDALPEAPAERLAAAGPRRVALLGRPNVGKSSLLNKLAGEQRALVDSVAGTTRDPVDELIELGGTTWRFVDTAGIRRRFRESQGADYYAALRTAGALDRAEVAVVLIDASQPLTEQDLRIISMVIEAGRALVIAYNKWDLTDTERRHYLEREIDRQLYGARWAPRVNISAHTGRHVERLVPAIEQALASWERRVSTGQLNAWLNQLVAATPPPMRGGRQPRILFATQAGIRPPHFVLFTTGFLEASYRRFIERRLREDFGFEGTPVKFSMRLREKRGRAGRSGGRPGRPASRRLSTRPLRSAASLRVGSPVFRRGVVLPTPLVPRRSARSVGSVRLRWLRAVPYGSVRLRWLRAAPSVSGAALSQLRLLFLEWPLWSRRYFPKACSSGRWIAGFPRSSACVAACPEFPRRVAAMAAGRLLWHFRHKPRIRALTGLPGQYSLVLPLGYRPGGLKP